MQVSGVPLPGNVPLVLPIMRRLGIREKIDELSPKRWDNGVTRGQAAEVVLACILHSNGPLALFRVKEYVSEWGLDVVLDLDATQLHDDKLGEMLDALVPMKEDKPDHSLVSELEQHCAHEAIAWLGLKPQQVLFDFTRLELSGAYEGAELPRRGRGSGAHKQVQIGLNVLADSGLPVLSRLHPGNANHTVNVPANLAELQARLPGRQLVVTTDAAGLCHDNIIAYNEAQMGFISPKPLTPAEEERMRSYPNPALEPLDYAPESGGRCWGLETTWRLERQKHEEVLDVRVLIVRSQPLHRQERQQLVQDARALEQRLCDIRSYLNQNRYFEERYARGQLEKALEKHESGRFVSYCLSGSDGALQLTWTMDYAALRAHARLLGRYVLFTNMPAEDYDASGLLRAYKSQHQVEANFRQLKSELHVAPVFLKKERRVIALAALYILALMIIAILQFLACKARLKTRRGRDVTARELLRTYGAWTGVAIRVGTARYIEPNPPTERQRAYLDALGFPEPDHWVAQHYRPPDHVRIPGR